MIGPRGAKLAGVTANRCVPAARHRLNAAVATLIDPIKKMHAGAVVSAPSLYEQLIGEMPTTKADVMGHRAGRSAPPLWTDALDVRIEIDDTTQKWQPDSPTTPARLRAIAARPWRPQDTRGMDKIAVRVESWLYNPFAADTGQREARFGALPSLRSHLRVPA